MFRDAPGFLLAMVLATAGTSSLLSAAEVPKGDGKAEWDKVVAAAKKEGRVVVAESGGAGAETRRLYTDGFQKQFPEIRVDLTVSGGEGSIAPRMLTERKAGRFEWDVLTGGTTTPIEYLLPAGVLDPIRPALILPEVTDPSKWFGRQIDFADKAGTHVLVFGGYVKPPFAFNSKLVSKKDIDSYWDLLDPKWKGKTVLHDPRRPGSGLAAVTFWYGWGEKGKEFVRRYLTEQDVKLTGNYRQQLEWLARGDYLIGIGHNNSVMQELLSKGLPLAQFTADDIKEANYVTAAIASVSLVNRAPRPNAAKVFINWMLAKETQSAWSKVTGFWSRRMDVSHEHLDPGLIPKAEKMSSYQLNYKEDWVEKREEIVKFLNKLIK
jgi:iron(III) transport system substrate-binding protein